MDIETDPFKRQEVPVPFAVGLYDGATFTKFWDTAQKTCIEQAYDFLNDQDEVDQGVVYMHNGGRFDFFYLLKWFLGKTVIMNSRIVKAMMPETKWEFRDSFAIMPFSLATYKKDHIDIQKLQRHRRKKHEAEINSYLKGDCVYLWELCSEFSHEFGDYLTIASAAFAQLSSMHKFDTVKQAEDKEMREKFYYGGRVQCFAKGVIEQPCKIYDVNSMYPAVMRDYYHPTSWCVLKDTTIRWAKKPQGLQTFFVSAEGKNYGAFPTRLPDGSVDFTRDSGVFHASIHEWNTAIELGTFKPTRVIATYNYTEYSRFYLFVEHFFKLRNEAKKKGDLMHTLFYKFILNSAYGKFAINPENYANWMITNTPEEPKGQHWVLDTVSHGNYFVWKQPATTYSWNLKNIATAASITGAARSILLKAIVKSEGVIYCDTDSIICARFAGGFEDEYKLGAWKLEAEGNRAGIGGKKLYAVFNDRECVKHASKGVVVTPEEIMQICGGQNVMSFRDAPTFQRDGSAKFIHRNVRMT